MARTVARRVAQRVARGCYKARVVREWRVEWNGGWYVVPLYTRHIVKVKTKGQVKLHQTIELYQTYQECAIICLVLAYDLCMSHAFTMSLP